MFYRATWLLLTLLFVVGCGGATAEKSEPKKELPPVKEQVARPGVGKKGRKLEKHTGSAKILAQPAVSYFHIKEKVAFDIQIPHALNLYKALNGRVPRSHKQFMSEIVEANNIVLPQLPENARYEYRPKDGKLWVVPKTPAQTSK